jgi:ACS family pantothenate transporter-like MFS transporter
MSWVTVICHNDAEERAIVTASMNAIGQAMAAWTQILQYPATHAPRFRAGFTSNLVTTIAQFISIGLIAYIQKRDELKSGRATGIA